MTDARHNGLFVSFFFMELFWLFAWVEFLMTSTAKLTIPVIPFLLAYFFSFAMARGFRTKHLRLIWVLLGHAVVFSFAMAFALWSATGRGVPPGSDIFQWYQFGLTGVLTGLFWYKGTKLCFRQMSYRMVCNYFDLGLALFFALLLVRLLVFYQSGISLPDAFFLYLLAGFFFSGLAAIFFSNASTIHKKQYIDRFHGAGVMISFIMVFLLCGMGFVFVLIPLLTPMADSGYMVLKDVSGSLSPYLIGILRFILTGPKHKTEEAGAPRDQGFSAAHPMGMTGEAGWFPQILFWGIWGLILAAGLILVCVLAFWIFRFLMQKPLPGPGVTENQTLWSGFRRFFKCVLKFLQNLILIFTNRIDTAQKAFSKLMAWGRKSGVSRHVTETPMEYAKRLQILFLPLENEILTIIHALHLEIYGEMKLTGPQIDRMKKALKRIHAPSFWFLRVKTGIKRF